MPASTVHLLAPARHGGLETVVASLARAQIDAGARVRVVGLFDEPPRKHPFWDALEARSVPSTAIVHPGRRYLREIREITAHLAGEGAALVHTHGYRADLLGLVAARRTGTPVVSTVHGFTGGDRRNQVYEWLQRRALRHFDGVVAVSSRLGAELSRVGVPTSRLHVLRNAWGDDSGIPDRGRARERLGIPVDGVPVVGWVGRMSGEKGPDVMLEAFHTLLREEISGMRPRLCMVGDGPMREALARRAGELVGASGPEERIRFTGPVDAAGELLRAFDVVVLSSRSEGTPMVLLEAMSAGVPVVTTAVGGIPDVVGEGEAWLVEPEDPAALGRAIREALQDPSAAADRAAAARRRLESDFGTAPWVAGYERVYASCIPERR